MDSQTLKPKTPPLFLDHSIYPVLFQLRILSQLAPALVLLRFRRYKIDKGNASSVPPCAAEEPPTSATNGDRMSALATQTIVQPSGSVKSSARLDTSLH